MALAANCGRKVVSGVVSTIVVTFYRVVCGAVHQMRTFSYGLSFGTSKYMYNCCTELRVPTIYVLPIDSGLSVWWSVEYAT